jgi:hypothetical protein
MYYPVTHQDAWARPRHGMGSRRWGDCKMFDVWLPRRLQFLDLRPQPDNRDEHSVSGTVAQVGTLAFESMGHMHAKPFNSGAGRISCSIQVSVS